VGFFISVKYRHSLTQELKMTLDEIKEAFAKATVAIPGGGQKPRYQYYLMGPEGTQGAGTVATDDLESMVPILAQYGLAGYTHDTNYPCFGEYIKNYPNFVKKSELPSA